MHNWGLAALLGKAKTHVLQGFAASQAGYRPSIVHKGVEPRAGIEPATSSLPRIRSYALCA